MNGKLNVACIQNCAQLELGPGVEESTALLRRAHAQGAQLACLPELFACLSVGEDGLQVGDWSESQHPALPHFASLARELGLWVLLGSLAVREANGKFKNRSYLLNGSGEVVARYDKVHLFDVDLDHGERYRESDLFDCGDESVLAETPWGALGLTICYDLRFPHLYRTLAQAGACYLAIPAAFTKTTGEAHWHTLVRSRAIETGAYVFAPCQYGRHGKAETFGHSLIVDPWGRILADAGQGPGLAMAEIDVNQVFEARRRIPALSHDRPYAKPRCAKSLGRGTRESA